MPIRLTTTIKVLLAINVVVFLFQNISDQFFGTNLSQVFGLVPAGFVIDFKLWQIITYSFLHGDLMHLVLNLLMIAFVGADIEQLWGKKRFLLFYFFCSVFAGVCYLAIQTLVWKNTGLQTPMVGASGAIYGLLIAYGIFFGERVMLFMMLFPMKAKHFIWVLAAVEFFSILFSRAGGGLASVAHLGGMLGGFLMLWGQAYLSVQSKKKKPPQHLKLIINNVKSFEKDNEKKEKTNPKIWH